MSIELGSGGINKIYLGNTEIKKVYLGSDLIYDKTSGGGFDIDATAYLNALAIPNDGNVFSPYTLTGSQIWTLTNNLFVGLKTDGIYTKIKAMYPMLGGTASLHKFNAVNPLDTDAAFRLTFNGGWTHSATGAKGNGVDGYAETHFNPRTELSKDNVAMGYYCRTSINDNTSEALFGNYGSAAGDNGYYTLWPYYNNKPLFRIGNDGDLLNKVGSEFNVRVGLFSIVNDAVNTGKLYENGTLNYTDTSDITETPSSNSMYINANNNNGSPIFYSDAECAMFYLAPKLDATEMANLYNSVQAFQTSLNRQV